MDKLIDELAKGKKMASILRRSRATEGGHQGHLAGGHDGEGGKRLGVGGSDSKFSNN